MVRDMEESLNFYREIVGLNLEKRFKAGPGLEIALLGDGETKIELTISANPHTRFFFVNDPYGSKIQFVEHK